MKIQLNVNEKITIQTPFGEVELSVQELEATIMYQSDNVKECSSTGNGFDNENGERVYLQTIVKDSSYKKNQIGTLVSNYVKGENFMFFYNESLNTRSKLINVDSFVEYCGLEEGEFVNFNNYDLLSEYLFENDISLDESLGDTEDYYRVTNFK